MKAKQNINLGIIGAVAMLGIITLVVLTLSSINNLTAQIMMKQVVELNSKDKITLDPTLPTPDCEHDGINQCKDLYLKWTYPSKTITENYEKCANEVRNICGQSTTYTRISSIV